MNRFYVDQAALLEFLGRLSTAFNRPGRLYLVGETSQLFEGWYRRIEQVTVAAQVAAEDQAGFSVALDALQNEMGIQVVEEAPGDVIPLPAGHASRARLISAQPAGPLQLYHFDPYSVAFRLITRGDEPDYQVVLAYLQHGWVTVEGMNDLLADLLPRFTNETIQQDPAEFRRKFKGLLQMWRATERKA